MNRRGFTLIELLVVIFIISVLISIGSVTYVYMLSRGKVAETQQLIQQVSMAIEAYHNDERYGGDYPPSSLRAYKISTNGVNDGIESVVAHVFKLIGSDTFIGEVKDKFFANTDEDSIGGGFDPKWVFGDLKARELVDSWGNPLIYFHHCDYKEPGSHITKYKLGNKKYIQAKPQIDKKKGMYPNWNSFVIWSCGPNGENENGGGDDVSNFK
ncbi:MAG: type II secretion system GspH family protein [Planctomycetota bacterium]|nr:type II secretion system GspH family protein [Planctomycetota bacterium]